MLLSIHIWVLLEYLFLRWEEAHWVKTLHKRESLSSNSHTWKLLSWLQLPMVLWGRIRWILRAQWPASQPYTGNFQFSEQPCLQGLRQRTIQEDTQLVPLASTCMCLCKCATHICTHAYIHTHTHLQSWQLIFKVADHSPCLTRVDGVSTSAHTHQRCII